MNKKIWIEKELIRSPAFRSLSRWAILVYLDFLRKRQMEQVKRAKRSDEWVIHNNGEIVYPYTEAENKGIPRREFRNSIDELVEKGFLDITHQGSGGRANDMTKYFIDDRWKEYGTPSFRPAKNPRRKDSREGRGWSVYHTKKKKSPVTNPPPSTVDSSIKPDTPNTKTKNISSSKFAIPEKADASVTINNR